MIDYEIKEFIKIGADAISRRSFFTKRDMDNIKAKSIQKKLLKEQRAMEDQEKQKEFYSKCNELRTDLSNGFPNLYFSVHPNAKPSACSVSIWIKRDGRDSDGIGSYSIKDVYNLDDEFFKVLERISMELEGKDINNHFWCKGCDKVHHKDEYGYYYFSSNFCKSYLEKNPIFNKKIRSETYN